MDTLLSVIRFLFLTVLLLTAVFILCLIIFPAFREFCSKLFLHALGTVVICTTIFILAIIYIVSPIDLIPDPIPILGQLDDLGVFATAAITIPVRLIYSMKLVMADM